MAGWELLENWRERLVGTRLVLGVGPATTTVDERKGDHVGIGSTPWGPKQLQTWLPRWFEDRRG